MADDLSRPSAVAATNGAPAASKKRRGKKGEQAEA